MYKRPFVIYRDIGAEKENSVIRYIGNRVLRNNKNFLCAVTGETGGGKSWACVSIAEQYSKMFGIPFDPEKDCFFSFLDLLKLMNDKEERARIPAGRILIYDEMQSEANSRDWQSGTNKNLIRVLSTFRNLRFIVLFPTPIFDSLDAQARKLLHGEFQMAGFNVNTKMSMIVPRFLVGWNRKKQEPYRYKLLVKYKKEGKEGHSGYLLHNWELPKASNELLVVYERKKQEFSDRINAEMLNNQLKMMNKLEPNVKKSSYLGKVLPLYEKYGENYIQILKEIPEIGPIALEKYIKLIKKSANGVPIPISVS